MADLTAVSGSNPTPFPSLDGVAPGPLWAEGIKPVSDPNPPSLAQGSGVGAPPMVGQSTVSRLIQLSIDAADVASRAAALAKELDSNTAFWRYMEDVVTNSSDRAQGMFVLNRLRR